MKPLIAKFAGDHQLQRFVFGIIWALAEAMDFLVFILIIVLVMLLLRRRRRRRR
jgi:hypothetical protein|tara:strand:- start:3 stop:164 length:162 start_codon:yes stop_codon:yes gene_type:complete